MTAMHRAMAEHSSTPSKPADTPIPISMDRSLESDVAVVFHCVSVGEGERVIVGVTERVPVSDEDAETDAVTEYEGVRDDVAVVDGVTLGLDEYVTVIDGVGEVLEDVVIVQVSEGVCVGEADSVDVTVVVGVVDGVVEGRMTYEALISNRRPVLSEPGHTATTAATTLRLLPLLMIPADTFAEYTVFRDVDDVHVTAGTFVDTIGWPLTKMSTPSTAT